MNIQQKIMRELQGGKGLTKQTLVEYTKSTEFTIAKELSRLAKRGFVRFNNDAQLWEIQPIGALAISNGFLSEKKKEVGGRVLLLEIPILDIINSPHSTYIIKNQASLQDMGDGKDLLPFVLIYAVMRGMQLPDFDIIKTHTDRDEELSQLINHFFNNLPPRN